MFAAEEFFMSEEQAFANIKRAWSAPQKSKRLQAIHETRKAVVSIETAISKAEEKLAAVKEASSAHVASTTYEQLHLEVRAYQFM